MTGVVRLRPEGMVNPALDTGEVEVAAGTLEVLSESDTPPFPIEDRIEANEDLRLKYRYLDLRRPEMTTDAAAPSHDQSALIREYLDERGFVDVETPMLTRSTPEGARDFLVPLRLFPGTFYALPQSPQQLKQLLMVAGQDRYYQIVRCFRDETSRRRSWASSSRSSISRCRSSTRRTSTPCDGAVVRAARRARSQGVEVRDAVPAAHVRRGDRAVRLRQARPAVRDGAGRPRTACSRATGFNAFASVLTSEGRIKAIAAPGGGAAVPQGARRARHRDEGPRRRGPRVDGRRGGRRPLAGREASSRRRSCGVLAAATGARPGDLILIVADRADRVAVALDGLRRTLAARLGLVREGRVAVLLGDRAAAVRVERGGRASGSRAAPPVHGAADEPISSPETAKARAYDLVLNGFELGGGSIRIHRPDVQRKVFEALGHVARGDR